MIIKCKKLYNATAEKKELQSSVWITKEKEYIVLGLVVTLNQGIMAVIKTDHHNIIGFQELSGFEIISQKIPKNWKMQASDNFYFYFMPEGWMYPEFFDELSEDKSRAIELLNKEAKIIYQEEGKFW